MLIANICENEHPTPYAIVTTHSIRTLRIPYALYQIATCLFGTNSPALSWPATFSCWKAKQYLLVIGEATSKQYLHIIFYMSIHMMIIVVTRNWTQRLIAFFAIIPRPPLDLVFSAKTASPLRVLFLPCLRKCRQCMSFYTPFSAATAQSFTGPGWTQ